MPLASLWSSGVCRLKVYVLTGPDNKIIGTLRFAKSCPFVISTTPLPGQELHEIDLPKELEKEYDAEKLHRQLAQLIRKKEQY